MIDLEKQYRTKNGREVRIYAIDGTETTSVHGAIKGENGWFITNWRSDGISGFPDYDLVEVKPRIKRTFWLNVSDDLDYLYIYQSKELADKFKYGRIACVKVEIDCEEGEGL